jgi:aromatic-L-amino-acid decarboxylase
MLPESRPVFEGWENADSIVINPHKWMGTSLDCSVLLFRDADTVRRSLSLTPAYLETDERDAVNLMEYGLPLGRRFRGLKLWTLFRCVGTEGLRRTFRRHIELAEGFEGALRETGAYEIAAPTSFATCCFRLAAREGEPGPDADARNRALLAGANADGRVFLSHTELDGRYTLRLSVGGVRSGQRQIEQALDALERARAELDTEGVPARPGSE